MIVGAYCGDYVSPLLLSSAFQDDFLMFIRFLVLFLVKALDMPSNASRSNLNE